MNRLLAFLIVIAGLLVGVAVRVSQAQSPAALMQPMPSVGVPPFHEIDAPRLRISVNGGVDIGRASTTPLTLGGCVSYDFDEESNLGPEARLDVRESIGSGRTPSKRFQQFALLGGAGFDEWITHIAGTPMPMHLSVLTGIAFVDYQERYRRRFRGAPVDPSVPPNVAQYSFGIPVMLGASMSLLRHVALGAELFGCVSGLSPSYGAELQLTGSLP